MVARSLPDDVELLPWLAQQLGIAESTAYRLAPTGALAAFGLFKVGSQYRVSRLKAIRAIHGAEAEPTPKDAS
jgi:hypothetical protein